MKRPFLCQLSYRRQNDLCARTTSNSGVVRLLVAGFQTRSVIVIELHAEQHFTGALRRTVGHGATRSSRNHCLPRRSYTNQHLVCPTTPVTSPYSKNLIPDLIRPSAFVAAAGA